MAKKYNKRIHQCDFFEQTITVKCRKSLMISFDNSNNDAVELIIVIGLNPSKADDFNSDHTVSVIKNYFKKKCRKLIIYNLFQNYSTNPSGIIEETVTDFTESTIQKKLQNATEIVIAWGDETKYTAVKKQAINQLKKYTSKLRMFQNPNTMKCPCHPRNGLNHLIYKNYCSDIMDTANISSKLHNTDAV